MSFWGYVLGNLKIWEFENLKMSEKVKWLKGISNEW